jgi:Tfp pilus assembly protein PilF
VSESEFLVEAKPGPNMENASLIEQHQRSELRLAIRCLVSLLVLLIVLTAAIQAQDTASPEQLFSRGVEFLKGSRLEEAEAAFLEALQEGMDNAGLHQNLGIVYQRQRLHEKAIGEFREALARDPDLQA